MRLVLLVILSAAASSVQSSYSGFSESLISSLTNLWNEDAVSNPSNGEENIWRDLLDDSADSLFSDEPNTLGEHQQKQSEALRVRGPHATTFQQHIKNIKLNSPPPKVRYGKFLPQGRLQPKNKKGDGGPLYHAVYKSKPFTYEELLHYYDYLDDSDETSKSRSAEKEERKDPNCTRTIESMLDRFLKSFTVLAQRPIVVQGNTCCKGQADGNSEVEPEFVGGAENPNASPTSATASELVTPPSYYQNITDPGRYAENQKDLIEKAKEHYDSLLKILNSTDTVGSVNGQTSPPSSTMINVVTTTTPLETTPIPTTTSKIVPTTTSSEPITTTSTTQASIPVDPNTTLEPETPSDASETTSEEPVTETPDTTTTAADTEETTTPPAEEGSRRKRRAIEESSSEAILKLFGNSTLPVTFVMNSDPIVEHIHANLLKREERYRKKYSPLEEKIKKKRCRSFRKNGRKGTKNQIETVEIISDPPDFIETVEVY